VEDDGVDWHDFILVQTFDLFKDEEPEKVVPAELQESEREHFIKEQIKINFGGGPEKTETEVVSKALDPSMKIKKNYERVPLAKREEQHERKLE